MTEEIYALWREAWSAQNPHRTPPTFKQFRWLCENFDIQPDELFATLEAK